MSPARRQAHTVLPPIKESETTDFSCSTSNCSVDPAFTKVDQHSKLRRAIATLANVNSENGLAGNSRSTTPPPDIAASLTNPSSKHHGLRAKVNDVHVGRLIKEKWSHSNHEDREFDYAAKAERVRHTREAMERAMVTGERQLVEKDADGEDVYVDPPSHGQYHADAYGEYHYGYGCPGYLSVPGFLLGGLLLAGCR